MNFTTNDYDISMQFFGWLDYALFILMLALSTMIGVYFGFWGKKENSPKEYLHGGKSMSTFPVAISLVSSFISGITIMGAPTEIYRFGTQYWLIIVSAVFVGICIYYFYLPVFYELQLTSTYEYLELRFNHRVRMMGSVLYTIGMLLYIPIVVYVPAIVFSQASGLNLHYITVGTSVLCIFYTMLGGIKAVIWTDFMQGLVMVVSSIVVIILGVIHAGGFGNVWEINQQGGRIIFFEMNPSPLMRVTFWSAIFGNMFHWIYAIGVDQSTIQKLMSLPSYLKARRSMIFCIIGIVVFNNISFITGLLIYAQYHKCDPIASKAISRPDQLATYYVLDITRSIPGLPGLFVAGIFSAGLSSMSSTLNSLSATVFEDFVRPYVKQTAKDETRSKILKCIVAVIGAICLVLVFLVDRFESILQLTTSVYGVVGGAILGLFTFGMFFPRGNDKGAFVGSLCSLLFMGWIVFGAQTAIASGNIKQPTLPTSIEGCDYNVTIPEPVIEEVHEEVFILYRLSFMYYTMLGLFIMLIVATIVSYVTAPPELNKMNPSFFTPIVRKYVERHVSSIKKNAVEVELLNNPVI